MLFKRAKDGGPLSKVWGYWLIELKNWFSIVLLRFEDGSREAYHSHAFDCFSWVLKGKLVEQHFNGEVQTHKASIFPFMTYRDTFHKVNSEGRTWVLSFRGPWKETWDEYDLEKHKFIKLTHERKEI